MPFALHDAHLHLGFTSSPCALACQAAREGSLLFCQTVDPGEFARLEPLLADASAVRLGLGLHPWWVKPGQQAAPQLGRFLELLPSTRFVGEVGLDLSPRRRENAAEQLRAFRAVLDRCAARPEVVLSVHCVGAADVLLDQLERWGSARQCAVVFHWFSGSSNELTRARNLDCWFSVGPRMLGTKRGRAYVQAVSPTRLLLETDLPEGGSPDHSVDLDFARVRADLQRAQELVDAARGGSLAAQIAQNARELLGPIR